MIRYLPPNGIPCKGFTYDEFYRSPQPENKHLSPAQAAWMLQNKPIYYTGLALTDLPHLPMHLRHV